MDESGGDKRQRKAGFRIIPVVCLTLFVAEAALLGVMNARPIVYWFQANWAAVVSTSAEEAAIVIVRKYEDRNAASYLARRDREAESEGSREIRFIVSRDGRDCAKVMLVPFLGLGWQEGSYARLGN